MSKKVKLSPVHLAYWCRTSFIDEIVCKRKNVPFDKKLADHLEKDARHYFIVDKKGNYDVVSGVDFEAYFNDKDVAIKDRIMAPDMPIPDGLQETIDDFINEVHGV